ncbi:four helix bundle protein [Patescibacteria group bacterium]|nr:four helix bundle protein [Patescibacteria group bacterium]
MEETAGYKKLNLFQRADELVILIYKCTKNFPREEIFGLVSQMRRAAVSVPANIAEGYSRNNKRERLQFYCISRGSLAEIDYYIELSFKLKYLDEEQYKELSFKRSEVGRMLNGFINYHIRKN